jgi:Fe2+ or Zn2+ uptake regulation protein
MADEFAGEVATRLQEAGQRATRPRHAVIRALRAMGGHHPADEVHAHLVDGQHGRFSALADAAECCSAPIGYRSSDQ